MMSRWKRPGINMNMSGKTAEFAGMQYILNDSCGTPYKSIIRDQIWRLAFSRFKYYGCSQQQANTIEYYLLTQGVVGFVNSKFDITTQSPAGLYIGQMSNKDVDIDFYGNPTSCMIVGYNGKEIIADNQNNFVIGYDSTAHLTLAPLSNPIASKIDSYVKMIDNALQAWFVAAETRKSGTVFAVKTERQKKFLQSILNKISQNTPFIVTLGEMDGINTETMFAPSNTDAVKDYHDYLLNCISYVLDDLGLENQPQQKQERLVVTEAENNRNLSRYLGADALLARKNFCDELREKGLADWRVEFYLDSVAEETMNQANKEGDDNVIL